MSKMTLTPGESIVERFRKLTALRKRAKENPEPTAIGCCCSGKPGLHAAHLNREQRRHGKGGTIATRQLTRRIKRARQRLEIAA